MECIGKRCGYISERVSMKKSGRYFTKEKKTEMQSEPKDTRIYFRRLLLYVAILLGAVAIWMIVNAKGTAYLTAFLLAFFIIVTCVEVHLANPEKKEYSLLKKILYKHE